MYDKLYLVVNTSSIRHAGTKSEIVLILTDNNWDTIHHTFDIPEGLEEGSTKVLSIDVSNRNLPNQFDHARVGIRGADAWSPGHILLWGEKKPEQGKVFTPLALRLWGTKISTDEQEGRLSLPLSRAYESGNWVQMNRIALVINNSKRRHAGTKNAIKIEVSLKNDISFTIDIPEGALGEDGGTFLDISYARNNTFRSTDLRSITMEIMGDDAWMPDSLFFFGLDNRSDEREYLVPFAYIPDWKEAGLPQMSTDEKEGSAKVDLYRAYL